MKTLVILAKEWSDKVNGNSYFSAKIYFEDQEIELPYQYGYGNQYESEAGKKLHELGLIKLEQYNNGGHESLWQYCRKNDIKLISNKAENCKKRYLK